MAGDWECERLDDLVCRIFRADVPDQIAWRSEANDWVKARFFNLQRRGRAFNIGRAHYDIGNDFYARGGAGEALLICQLTFRRIASGLEK